MAISSVLRPLAPGHDDSPRRARRWIRVEQGVVAPVPDGSVVVDAGVLPGRRHLHAVPQGHDGAAVRHRLTTPVLQEPDVVLELAVAGSRRRLVAGPGGERG